MSAEASGTSGQALPRRTPAPDRTRIDAEPGEARWGRRRVAATSLRAGMVAGPVIACVFTMAVLSRMLPTPERHSGTLPRIGWWAAVLVGSLIAMLVVDRLARRLAPLAALLDMAVLFPGRAPTRFAVARRAGDLRHLETLSKRAREAEQPTGLSEAAAHILSLVGALRAHDRHTRGHSERVRVYTDLIADQMRLPTAAVDRLRWAALLHDIGKLRVPTSTLNKPAKLSTREWEVIREHPMEGARLASALLPWLREWGCAIAEHHERFDGSGYPEGLQAKSISLSGRIVAVADAFEVMTAPRTYKKAMTRPAALAELVRASGSQFDPEVVRALLQVSAPRLRWAMGPTSWLVGTPLLGSAPSLTSTAMVTQASVGVTTVAVVGVTGLASTVAAAAPAPSSIPPRPAVSTVSSSPSAPTQRADLLPRSQTATSGAGDAAASALAPSSTALITAVPNSSRPRHQTQPTPAANPTPPGQLKAPPAHAKKPPGHAKTPPGHTAKTASASKAPPGEEKNAAQATSAGDGANTVSAGTGKPAVSGNSGDNSGSGYGKASH
ncbi:MAG: HD-GYP domain-containing protein [Acidothermaceae bacterium]